MLGHPWVLSQQEVPPTTQERWGRMDGASLILPVPPGLTLESSRARDQGCPCHKSAVRGDQLHPQHGHSRWGRKKSLVPGLHMALSPHLSSPQTSTCHLSTQGHRPARCPPAVTAPTFDLATDHE